MSKSSLYLIKGQSYKLSVKGVSGKVKWKSEKKSVATVSSNGKVKARKKGTAVITAKVGNKTYKCKVKVCGCYSDKKLISMVKKYYKSKGYTIPKNLYIDIDRKTGNKVLIHIYTVVNDGPNSGHTATWDWFEIYNKTCKGVDQVLYQTVDFSKFAN